MPVVGVIQARLSSSRLPGKVLLPLAGRPVLWHVIQRLRAATRVDDVVVATSTDSSDDAVASTCAEWGVRHVRGPLDDVLARFCIAIRATGADVVVRLPADKPLLDPVIVDTLVNEHLASRADYTTNMGPEWPRDQSTVEGLEAEVASGPALLNANDAPCTNSDREHVMPYLYRADHGYRVHRVTTPNPFGGIRPRLNLDAPEDYEVIKAIYDSVAPVNNVLPQADVREFLLAHPELVARNAAVAQRGV
jgi:spore coat polysaccharide biosynthesis protein SpsF